MRLSTRACTSTWVCLVLTITFFLTDVRLGLAASASGPVASKMESIDALYKEAKAEDRVVI